VIGLVGLVPMQSASQVVGGSEACIIELQDPLAVVEGQPSWWQADRVFCYIGMHRTSIKVQGGSMGYFCQ